MTTMFLPAASGRAATCRAAQTAAPDEMPTRMPSFVPTARAVSIASGNSTSMTSSMTLWSRIAGTKFGPMPWILCGPGVPLVSSGESAGSTAMTLRAGHALLEHLTDAGDGAAGADAGDEVVDLALGVADDLLGGGLAVDRGVRLVLELAGKDRAGDLGDELLGLRDRALHAAGGIGQDQFGTVRLQQQPTLDRHRRRHRRARPGSRGRPRPSRGRCRCCRWWPRRWCRRAGADPDCSAASTIATPRRSLTHEAGL